MVALNKDENEQGATTSSESSNGPANPFATPNTADSPTTMEFDESESHGGLTDVWKAEKKQHEAKTSLFRVLKWLSIIAGALVTIGIAVWAYRVGSVAEPIGFLKSELGNLKEAVIKLDEKVNSNEKDLIRIKTFLDVEQRDKAQ